MARIQVSDLVKPAELSEQEIKHITGGVEIKYTMFLSDGTPLRVRDDHVDFERHVNKGAK